MENTERKNDQLVTVKFLMRCTGLKARRIQQLVNDEGLPGKSEVRGKYWGAEFLEAYRDYKKEHERSEGQKSAKDRQDEIKAKTAELNYAVRIGELMPAKAVQETIISELKKIQENVYAIPKRNSIKLLQAQNRVEIEDILNGQLDAAFHKYADDVKPPKRRKSNPSGSAKKKSAATKKVSKRRAPAKTKTANKPVGRKV